MIERISEQRILAAVEKGEFDNLPGAGKPFRWEDDTHTPQEKRLAYALLKKNGFSLPWIEEGREIRDRIDRFRRELARRLSADALTAGTAPFRSLQDELHQLNKTILDYNRSVPLERFQMVHLNFELEIDNAARQKRIDRDWCQDVSSAL